MNREKEPDYLSGNPNVIDFESARKERNIKPRKERIRGGLVNISAFALSISAIWGLVVYGERQDAKPTGDQSAAYRKFNSLQSEFKVHDLIVGPEGVNLRDRPRTEGSVEGSAGEIEGKLEPGSKIESAIKVIGNDDDFPWAKDRHDVWYAFPNPQDPDEIVFANSEFIQATDSAALIPVVELEK